MSLDYGYLFTYEKDGKRLPSKRDIQRVIKDSVFEGDGIRDLKIQINEEIIHLSISTYKLSIVSEVFITKGDERSSIYSSELHPCHYYSKLRIKLISEAFLDSAKMLIKSLKNLNKEDRENSIKSLFKFAFQEF